MRRFQHKFLIFGLIILTGFLGLTRITNASIGDLIGGITLAPLGFIAAVLNYIIGYLGSLLVTLGAGLANWALDFNSHILPVAGTTSIVGVGWVITRDLANLLFVLVIIIIAFATILRVERYEMKKLIRNLIFIALIVNFSLVIAGVFIDFSGILTNFFINAATGNSPTSLGTALVGSFGVQKFLGISGDTTNIGNILSFDKSLSFIASTFFITIFTLIAAISLIGLAFMFFFRYMVLTFLLIVMPLAWTFSIFPDFASQNSKWWSYFFNWVWFAPAASFFIYLAISVVKLGGFSSLAGTDQILNPNGSLAISIQNFGQNLGQMITVIGILVGGLITANKMGIHGANATLKLANQARIVIVGGTVGAAAGAVSGAAAGAATGFGGYVRQKVATAGAGEGQQSYVQRAANTFAKVPGFRGIATGLNQLAKEPSKRVEDEEKAMDSWTGEMIKNAANSGDAFLREPRAAALVNKMASTSITDPQTGEKKLVLDTLDPGRRARFIEVSKKLGTTQKILAARPDLAVDLGLPNAATAIRRFIRPNKIQDVSVEAFKSVDVVKSLPNNYLEMLGKEGGAEQLANVKNVVAREIAPLAEKISALPEEARDIENAKRIHEFIKNNVLWQG